MKNKVLKSISLNHLKLVLVDSRHNFFHQLIVILIRLISFLILVPLCVYSAAIGFLLSAETLQLSLPSFLIKTSSFFLSQVPYYYTIKQFIFTQLNHWYKDAPFWWTITVGIPLMLVGFSLSMIALFNLYYSIFSPFYNRTHCPFCKQPLRVEKK